VFWEIAVANSRDRTIGGILPVWFDLQGIAIGSCSFAIVSAGDLWSGVSIPTLTKDLDGIADSRVLLISPTI